MAGPARQLRQAPGQLTPELHPEPEPARGRWAAAYAAEARELILLGGAMLAAAFSLPALPGHPGLPCPLRTLTGVPCPMCGMTTSVEATVHLDLAGALAANPAGIALVVLAVVLLVRRPKTIPIPPLPVVLVALSLMWIFELHRFGFV